MSEMEDEEDRIAFDIECRNVKWMRSLKVGDKVVDCNSKIRTISEIHEEWILPRWLDKLFRRVIKPDNSGARSKIFYWIDDNLSHRIGYLWDRHVNFEDESPMNPEVPCSIRYCCSMVNNEPSIN